MTENEKLKMRCSVVVSSFFCGAKNAKKIGALATLIKGDNGAMTIEASIRIAQWAIRQRKPINGDSMSTILDADSHIWDRYIGARGHKQPIPSSLDMMVERIDAINNCAPAPDYRTRAQKNRDMVEAIERARMTDTADMGSADSVDSSDMVMRAMDCLTPRQSRAFRVAYAAWFSDSYKKVDSKVKKAVERIAGTVGITPTDFFELYARAQSA